MQARCSKANLQLKIIFDDILLAIPTHRKTITLF